MEYIELSEAATRGAGAANIRVDGAATAERVTSNKKRKNLI